jgi:phosphatidylglycerol:prolipoprotein diacylglycerol transferase
MIFVIPFPAIDPVLVEFGPFVIRWYALAYIAGILLGWRYMLSLAARRPGRPNARDIDDVVVWATIGTVLGGRLGYVLFYKPAYFLANPEAVLFVWQGGMSFHGGLIGVLAAVALFTRRRGIGLPRLADLVACAAPIGLFFGRLANFINGELWGRPSDVPWAIVFPRGGPLPRHPSQLYEAALEGMLLFVGLWALWRLTKVRERPGFLFGAFLAGYGVSRLIVELFRQPDAHLGFLLAGATMGQLLSLPMIAAGLWLMARAKPAPAPAPATKQRATKQRAAKR